MKYSSILRNIKYIYIYIKRNKYRKIKNTDKNKYLNITWNYAKNIALILSQPKPADFIILWMFITSKECLIVCNNSTIYSNQLYPLTFKLCDSLFI